jgi:L-arabinonolactonase
MELAFAQEATLGECAQWHAGRWWWTDIESSVLHSWTDGEAQAQTVKLPARLGAFAHTRSGRVLMGLAKRLALADLDGSTAHLQPLVPVDAAEARTRINDGRTDRRGFFVFGTMNEVAEERRAIGSFYQYSMQHGLRRLALPAAAIANSICFSLDGNTMYFCDTVTRVIQQCDYDAETAQVTNIRPFAVVDTPHAWPDGSVIDAEGCLWNAQWGGSQVVQYASDGTQMRVVRVPVKHTSCPAFGGDDLRTLMVTTARQELSREELAAKPLSGSLFTLTLSDARGLPSVLFDDAPQT